MAKRRPKQANTVPSIHSSKRRARDHSLVGVELNLGLLLEGVLGDRLERLLDIDGLLGRGLKVRDVTLGLAPGHRPLLGDLRSCERE